MTHDRFRHMPLHLRDSNPRDELPEVEPIATDEDFEEAKRRLRLKGKQPDGFTEYRLAEQIARGEA